MNTIDTFISRLDNYTKLADEAKQFIRDNIPIKTYRKGDYLLKENEISTAFYFNIQGCLRLFYLVDGEERTSFFYTENQFISSYKSYTKQLPANHFIQCLEDCVLAVITMESAFALLKQFPEFEFLARTIMEEELIVYQEIVSDFITLNPEQRYLNLLNEKPMLFQRIPQRQLATYLGIKAESLSRIKKRLNDKRSS